jgi:hypothetical protein
MTYQLKHMPSLTPARWILEGGGVLEQSLANSGDSVLSNTVVGETKAFQEIEPRQLLAQIISRPNGLLLC